VSAQARKKRKIFFCVIVPFWNPAGHGFSGSRPIDPADTTGSAQVGAILAS